MRKVGSAFEKGRSAFYKNVKRNPTDDKIFMQEFIAGSQKADKLEKITDWKAGWDSAKADSEAPVETPKKKKKTSKKKSKK